MNNRVCKNCVMDNTDSQITFDEKGICDHCQTYYRHIEPMWKKMRADNEGLKKIADKIKYRSRGNDFDCIIGISGGIDSSYLTYIAKERMGLNPLVFHVDAGWNSQTAVNNIEKLIDGLGVDLFTEVIDWEEMKDLQLAYFKSGVPHIDVPQDHSFFATMYRFANKYKVKYILTGANYSTECIRNPIEWMYYQSDSTQLRAIHNRFGSRPLRAFPTTSILWHKVFLKYVKGISVIRPLDWVDYKKEEAMDFLINNFNWQRYEQKHFESRFTRFYEGYWLPERFGYDTRKVQYSSLILTGQMTREEALEKLKKPSYNPEEIEHEKQYVANKLGVSVDVLMSFIKLPKKTFKDYPSQWWIYKLGARVMRLLGLERGGKR